MAQFIIIETWNGEGYSYSNKAYLMDFPSEVEAQVHIEELLSEHEADCVTERRQGFIQYEIGEDAGTFHCLPYDGEYGVVIHCNTNDAFLVNQTQYDKMYAKAIAQADPDDEVEGGFIGAYEGEYDYQFIKLEA